MSKRGLIISDLHCGHRVGLTPPAWQYDTRENPDSMRAKWGRVQKALWNKYTYLIADLGPFDFCIYGGDGIDGDGGRSGGSELISTGPDDQVDMCVECLDQVRLNANPGYEIVGVYGTPYHTGVTMDHENALAEKAGFKKIGSHEWIDVNGCVFDVKHKVGSSGIPHGRHTAIAKEKLWSMLWAERDMQPKANVFIRGHVHYHNYCGGPDWVAMTLPALQGMGSKYGARQCSGLVDWGVTVFDIEDDGTFDWQCHTVRVKEQKATAVVL